MRFRFSIRDLLWLTAVVAISSPVDADEPAALPTRADIIKHLAEFESPVKSCSAEFDLLSLPTSETQIVVIKHVIDKQFRDVPPDPRWGRTTKEEEYKHYVYTPETMNQNSYSGRLFRDGLQMRLERFALDKLGTGDPQRITAFDGKFVQTLHRDAETNKGFVQAADKAHWNSAPDENPFNLVFEYYGRPWSKAIQESPDCKIIPVAGPPPAVWEVELSDGPQSNCVLQLDSRFRILVREDYHQFSQDKQLRLYQRQESSNWKNKTLGNGESISFPERIVLQFVVGKTEVGELAVYREDVITVRSIEFNRPIDPALFTIDFPAGIPVDDDRKLIDPKGH
jgi:hypothetical protein